MKGKPLILAACLAAAALLILTLVLLPKRRGGGERQDSPSGSASADGGAASAMAVGCGVPEQLELRALRDAENPPVILWAVGEVRLFIDGQPVFSPPEEPKRFATGEHTLRAEAPGQEPLSTRFTLAPFTPALFHVERDSDVGMTLVRISATCTSCPAPMNILKLDHQKSGERPAKLLREAAAELRSDQWYVASKLLRKVPVQQRRGALFRRLVSAVHVGARDEASNRAALRGIPGPAGKELGRLIQRTEELAKSEQARRGTVVLSRWNKVTERFNALITRFEERAPGATASAAQRLSELSDAFELGVRARDIAEQERLVAAAERTLGAVVAQIRAARPADCTFQADVVATVAQ